MEEEGGDVVRLQLERASEVPVGALVEALPVIAEPQDELGLAGMARAGLGEIGPRRLPRLRVTPGLDETEGGGEPRVEHRGLARRNGGGGGGVGRRLDGRRARGEQPGQERDHALTASECDLAAPGPMPS
jgi:hypothetical protein